MTLSPQQAAGLATALERLSGADWIKVETHLEGPRLLPVQHVEAVFNDGSVMGTVVR